MILYFLSVIYVRSVCFSLYTTISVEEGRQRADAHHLTSNRIRYFLVLGQLFTYLSLAFTGRSTYDHSLLAIVVTRFEKKISLSQKSDSARVFCTLVSSNNDSEN